MFRYLVFATVSLVLLLAGINSTAIAVAFPVMTSSFDASLILAGWVLSAYQLVIAAIMPLAGKLSDAFGRKRTFIIFLSLFTIGSLLCAIAPNVQWLIVFRIIQATGGGGFLPSAAGIVADEFPRSRQQALGLFTSIFPIGQIIGPNLGGWLVSDFGWRSVFWFNIPLALIALLATALLLKPMRGEKGTHIDLLGAGLLAGSLFAFLIGLSEIGNGSGARTWSFGGLLFVTGIVLMAAFIRHESRVQDPIVELKILKARPFLAANVYNFIYGVCVLGVLSSFIPLYAVSIYHVSTLESGLILTPRSIGMMLASTVTSFFLVRWGYRRPILTGTIIIAFSLFLLGLEPTGISIMGMKISSTVLLLGIMLLAGLGLGIAAPAANNACIELMPNRVATITGIRGMFRQFGGASSIAITSVLLHNIGDMARGFCIVFFGLSAIMLIAIPAIFAMPSTTGAPPSDRVANEQSS